LHSNVLSSPTATKKAALNRRVDIIILDEKVENITAGEPANAFESAFAKLKTRVDAGLVKPLPATHYSFLQLGKWGQKP